MIKTVFTFYPMGTSMTTMGIILMFKVSIQLVDITQMMEDMLLHMKLRMKNKMITMMNLM